MITNYASLLAFVLSVGCLTVYALFLIPKQTQEVLKPGDALTRLRWIILTMLVISLITAVPSTVYQYYRATGVELELLRNVSAITSNLSKVATTVLLVLIFTYTVSSKK